MMAGILLVFCASDAQAFGIGPHWTITETEAPDSPGADSGNVYLTVENYHADLAIVAFGVGVPEMPYFDAWSTSGDWEAYNASAATWDIMDPGPTGDPMQDFFGVSWDEAFPGYDDAAVFVGVPPDGQIAPRGGRLGDSYEVGYLYDYGIPGSPAVILMSNGGVYLGPTNQSNPYQGSGGVIPEPATLTLLGLGVVGLAVRGRKRNRA